MFDPYRRLQPTYDGVRTPRHGGGSPFARPDDEHPEADSAFHHRQTLLMRHGDDARFRPLQREDEDARRRLNECRVADRALSGRGVSDRADAWSPGPIRPLSGNRETPPSGLGKGAESSRGSVYRQYGLQADRNER
jgi:hypothetical protein